MRTLFFVISFFALCCVATAQSSVVPIAEMKNGGLLGGVQNGKWINSTKFSAKMPVEKEFVLVSWKGVEEGAVSLGTKGEIEDVCPDFVRMKFELEQDHGVAIGSEAKWNPVPRALQVIDPRGATYRTVVANFLKRKGIARPVVSIKEAFRVDLEGVGRVARRHLEGVELAVGGCGVEHERALLVRGREDRIRLVADGRAGGPDGDGARVVDAPEDAALGAARALSARLGGGRRVALADLPP